jgi:hypothetical protein
VISHKTTPAMLQMENDLISEGNLKSYAAGTLTLQRPTSCLIAMDIDAAQHGGAFDNEYFVGIGGAGLDDAFVFVAA